MRREARRARTRDGRIAAAVARHGRCALKTVHVAAGIIRRMEDGAATGEVLAVQRGYGDMRGLWEFPGGKVERGETAEDACRRELAEELGITVEHLRAFYTVEYDYPDFPLSMECFFCRIATGEPTRSDRQLDLRWVGRGELLSLAWMPADEGLVEALAAAPAHDDEVELVRRRAAIRKSMQGNRVIKLLFAGFCTVTYGLHKRKAFFFRQGFGKEKAVRKIRPVGDGQVDCLKRCAALPGVAAVPPHIGHRL